MARVGIKRVYDARRASDGYRVLVDRLWPRGLSKARAGVDVWLKEVAPGTHLRQWFAHDPRKWAEFKRRYRAELQARPAAVRALRDLVRAHRTITLLYGAAETRWNHAVALQQLLRLPR